jgi:hypothetical protein
MVTLSIGLAVLYLVVVGMVQAAWPKNTHKGDHIPASFAWPLVLPAVLGWWSVKLGIRIGKGIADRAALPPAKWQPKEHWFFGPAGALVSGTAVGLGLLACAWAATLLDTP